MTPSLAGVSGARLLLDADVLYPIRVCDFILTASTNGLLQRPMVSDTILDEAQRNVVADRPDLDAVLIKRRFANVRPATDGYLMRIPKRFVDDAIINAKDRHVIAAAQFHLVDIVVSNDRRLRREVGTWAKRGYSYSKIFIVSFCIWHCSSFYFLRSMRSMLACGQRKLAD